MTALNKAIKIIREDILDSRTEIENCFAASEVRLLLKIEDLKNSVTNLERENSEIRPQTSSEQEEHCSIRIKK